jgi:hypothetical protein
MPGSAGWAIADETTPPAAKETSPPAATSTPEPADPSPKPDPAPIAGGPAAASAVVDTVLTSAAVHDSTSKASDAAPQAKDEAPAEQNENAATPSTEKLPEATLIPAAEAKPLESPAAKPPSGSPQRVAPTGGGGSHPRTGARPVARGIKGAPKNRALAKSPTSGKPPSTAPSLGEAPRSGVLHDLTESDRVASELERTERFVSRAQRSILLSKNTRAMKLYTSALDFQSDSREACKVRQYARAERLTLAARDFADRASRMVGPPREDPDYVDHVLRRTDDALERAKDVLKNGAGRYAWKRHEDLKQEQKDAWKIFKEGDVGGAYKQTLGVREGILALLRQLQDLPVPRETAEKAIGGAQAALEQANRELGPKPGTEALRLVRLANEYLAKARQSFQRGSYRSALLQAKVVERHVEHAVDVGRPRSAG